MGKAMGRGGITEIQIETIKSIYAESGSIEGAARAARVSWSTARKYIGNTDQYESIREEKRVDIIAKIAEVQIKLLDAMVDDAHLTKASMNELGVSFGIVTDKHQLLTGKATERYEHNDITPASELISRRIDELADRRRARESAGQPVTAANQ